jgi:hypothetical protein
MTSLTIFSFVFLKTTVSDYDILWRQVVLGIGISLFNPANNSAIIGSLPKDKVGLGSSLLPFARNLGIVVGVAFAEMVISLRGSADPLGRGGEGPSLESIQDVWRLVLILGLTAVLLSWTRERKTNVSGGKSL